MVSGSNISSVTVRLKYDFFVLFFFIKAVVFVHVDFIFRKSSNYQNVLFLNLSGSLANMYVYVTIEFGLGKQ
jgi:hypothetical protein